MPKQVQNPNVSRQLVEQFGVVGRMRPSLDEIIVPVVTVADLGRGAPPPTSRQATAFAAAGTLAGEYATFQLSVPAGIGARIDRLIYWPTTAGLLRVRFDADGTLAPWSNSSNGFWTDGRVESDRAAGVLSYDSTAGFAQQRFVAPAPTTGLFLEDVGWVIAGVNGSEGVVQFMNETIDETARLSVSWTEFTL